MNFDFCVSRLQTNVEVISTFVRGVTVEQARWKPQPDKWSILEVVNHLVDEDNSDFRARLDLLLNHPEQRWPPIDPPRWAFERRYNERDFGESIETFRRERARSLEWLGALTDVDWESRYDHPSGPISAGDLIASWVGHDLLHIRQLARLHWQYLGRQVAPHSAAYAGGW